jgi:hypothetical protein
MDWCKEVCIIYDEEDLRHYPVVSLLGRLENATTYSITRFTIGTTVSRLSAGGNPIFSNIRQNGMITKTEIKI